MLLRQSRPAWRQWFGIEPAITPALREALCEAIPELAAGQKSAKSERLELEITESVLLDNNEGNLAILAALAYPDAGVDAVDISGDALEVARRNVHDYRLD